MCPDPYFWYHAINDYEYNNLKKSDAVLVWNNITIHCIKILLMKFFPLFINCVYLGEKYNLINLYAKI